MTELTPIQTRNLQRGPNFRRYEGRREQMIDAALEVFFEKGYERARIEDVAKLSGVGKSAVLYHFGSKLGLLAKVVAKHCLPAAPLAEGPADQVIEASLADPAATKVLRFVLAEQRRLPSLGRLYVVALIRRVASWQTFDDVEAIRTGVAKAFGSMASRVLLEGYPAVEGERHVGTEV
jgi:AcrR family transcriptional regulator